MLAGGLATVALGGLLTPGRLLAALAPTARQTLGPFYPDRIPIDHDNDLVRFEAGEGTAIGTVAHVSGRVLDLSGRPVAGAVVEIWQCDAGGVYHHVGDRPGRDAGFQGFGRTTAGADGGYRFRTIQPVPYPGRTPHIHFRIVPPGGGELVTQLYRAGHPMNHGDFLYRRLGGPERQATVTAAFEPAPEIEPAAVAARFDIVLGERPG